MKLDSRQRWMSMGLGLLGLVVAALVLVAGELVEARLHERWRAQTLSELAGLRARLEGELNGTTNLTAGLVADVAINGGMMPERFHLLARELMSMRSLIRNITLAPDNVVSMVYPEAGNEAVIGLDLLHHPLQGPATRRMIDKGRAMLAGPVELVQGGRALIHRVPIYRSTPGAPPRSGPYWGLMSTPIDFDALLSAAGLRAPELRLALALRGVDGSGPSGAVFWGEAALFEHPDAVALDINLLDGSWLLAAVPLDSPPGLNGIRGWSRTVAALSAVFALLLAEHLYRTGRQLVQSEEQVRYLALHDSLTGLANRVQLDGRYRQAAGSARREGHRLALLYLDLDKFKPINDQYGHAAGDRALCAVADRLSGLVRNSDTVARVGGDEFVILLGRVTSAEDALEVAQKIVDALAQPLEVDGHALMLGGSIGVALYPDHSIDLYELMRRADRAMYEVKGDAARRVAMAAPQ